MFGALKWLENRETSVFLSLKGFNYCLLLEFSQVVYYNEGAISRSAPIFRDFQAHLKAAEFFSVAISRGRQ